MVTSVIAGRFCFARRRRRSNVASNNTELLQAIAELLEVLRAQSIEQPPHVGQHLFVAVHEGWKQETAAPFKPRSEHVRPEERTQWCRGP